MGLLEQQDSPFRCPRCFDTGVTHRVRHQDGEELWRNWCPSCGWEGEYLPTPEEIRRECQRLRAQRTAELDDEEEKALRRLGVRFEEDDQPPQPEEEWFDWEHLL